VLQAVNPPPAAGPSGLVPAADCAGDGGGGGGSSSSSSSSSNEDGDGDGDGGCDAGTLCCKDPQAAGAGTGACYKVSNCSVIRDGR
jgi:hypothetical protein